MNVSCSAPFLTLVNVIVLRRLTLYLNRRLAPAVQAVQAAPADTEIVAPGISCRQQIAHLAGRRAAHPAEALRRALAR